MFRDATADFRYRSFLKGVVANGVFANLACYDYDRNAVKLRVGDRRYDIGRAGTARRGADSDLACDARIALSGEAASLFVTREDYTDLISISSERLVEGNRRATGVPEDVFDATVDQRLDDDIGAVRHSDFFCRGGFHFFLIVLRHDMLLGSS